MKLNSVRARLGAAGLLAAVVAGGTASIAAATGGSGSGATTAGSGTVSVTVTRPNGQTRTRPTRPVTCSTTGGDYVLRFGKVAGRRRGSATITVSGYHGSGSYTGKLRVSVRGPLLRLYKTVELPVTLTSTGGHATMTRTLPGTVHPALKGKTVSATADWTCTP
jgi:hypothetical protein